MTRRRSQFEETEQQDSGSVWTSYSDMFTTVAIIFLVMFVFALIKSAVNSVKMAKSKKSIRNTSKVR